MNQHVVMENLTKRDIVVRISKETGIIQQDVMKVVQKTLDYIADAVVEGRNVELRNFGVFEIRVRKSRVGRNPNKPEIDVPIPEQPVVKFKVGKELRKRVLDAHGNRAGNKVQTVPKAAAKQPEPSAAHAPKSQPAPKQEHYATGELF